MNSEPAGGWIQSEQLSFAQALGALHPGAAYAGFAEGVGELEPGQRADFVLVDRESDAVNPQALYRTQVLETWVAGKKVWARSASGSAAERGK